MFFVFIQQYFDILLYVKQTIFGNYESKSKNGCHLHILDVQENLRIMIQIYYIKIIF